MVFSFPQILSTIKQINDGCRLKNSNHTLAEQKQELLNENSVLWEENKDYRRLKRAVGEERSKYLIQNEKSREMAEKNRRKENKQSHDRDAR